MNHKRLIRIFKDSKINSPHLPLLEAWNGNHEMASTEATLYNYLMAHILELSFKDEMKEEAFKSFLTTHLIKRTIYDFLENEQSIWWDNIETTEIESRSDIMQQAMDQTDLKLKKLFGNDPNNWTWAKMHTITHKHSFDAVPAIRNYFNVGPAPSPGGNMVLNNTGYVFDTDSIFQVTFGPAMRTIVHLTNPIEVYTILPTGQSGHFLSPHYDDQFELYNEGRYRKVHLNYDSTKVHAKSTLILKP